MMIKRFTFLVVFQLVIVLSMGVCKNDNKSDKDDLDVGPYIYLPAGMIDDASAIIPNGRLIRPAGERIEAGVFPMGLALTPDDKTLIVSSSGSNTLTFINTDDNSKIQTIKSTLFLGLAVSSDGSSLYVSGGKNNNIYIYDLSGDEINALDPIPLKGFPSGMALSRDDKTLYAVANYNSLFYAIDLEKNEIEYTLELGAYPYDIVLSPDGNEAYINNWCGNSVSVVDLNAREVVETISVGKNPEGVALSPDGKRLYVANADSDSVSVIDIPSRIVIETIDLSRDAQGLKAGSPNALAVDAERLYVAMAERNLVEVISLQTHERIGSIPVGWFPTRILLSNDEKTMYVSNSKGFGSRPNLEGRPVPGSSRSMKGIISKIHLVDILPELDSYTRISNENNDLNSLYCKNCMEDKGLRAAMENVEHIVLIVKENKTYDEVLGDLKDDEWHDPALCIFGRRYTPNTHALAEQFANLDNFFSDPECSIQGHMWTTAADCNTFVEKGWLEHLPLAGFEPASIAEAGNIFDHCLKHNVDFRIYGEPEMIEGMFDRYRDHIDFKYPPWSMGVTDVKKAGEFIRELNLGIFPGFVYICLPNDHTYGTTPGTPTPEYMVADNDRGLGMIVEAISRSPYWEKTIIFVIEDDPQSGSGDHIDAHRSICLAIGPYAKRGYFSHVHHSIPSIYKTIELILDLPPMNKNDRDAIPMFNIFTTRPDTRPFESLPMEVEYAENTPKSPMASESAKLDFTEFDRAPGLGLILWRAMKGVVPIPSYSKRIDK